MYANAKTGHLKAMLYFIWSDGTTISQVMLIYEALQSYFSGSNVAEFVHHRGLRPVLATALARPRRRVGPVTRLKRNQPTMTGPRPPRWRDGATRAPNSENTGAYGNQGHISECHSAYPALSVVRNRPKVDVFYADARCCGRYGRRACRGNVAHHSVPAAGSDRSSGAFRRCFCRRCCVPAGDPREAVAGVCETGEIRYVVSVRDPRAEEPGFGG